jgi:hypothetical protein
MAKLSEKISLIAGGTLIAIFILSSWFPRSCPLVRNLLIGCPRPPIQQLSAEEYERERIAHQVVQGAAEFAVLAEPGRTKTRIVFWYNTAYDHAIAHLMVRTAEGFQNVALITHPLLVDLNWSRVASSNPSASLYSKDGDAVSIEHFLTSLPNDLVTDAAARTMFQVSQSNDLLNLNSLEDTQYILTTFVPPPKDGTWRIFEHEYDLSKALVNDEGMLELLITTEQLGTGAFLIGSVHVDFRK